MVYCRGSIPGSLLFLIYIHNLRLVSVCQVLLYLLMAPICFTHTKTLIFCSHKNIFLFWFLKVNNKLHKINQQFISNKLSLIIEKAKCSFLYKRSKKDDISLLLPKLKTNNYQLKWAESIKVLGVALDKNSTQIPHIKYIKHKNTKNIGLLFKAKPFLNKLYLAPFK